MSKSVTDPYPVFSAALGNQTMTGTNVLTSVVTSIKHRDTVAYQLQWTGTPAGTFGVQVSNDYNPGLPESAQGSGALNNGTWTDVTLTPTPTTSGNTSGTINLTQLGSVNVRCIYTNASSSGVLTGFISAKSLG